MPPWFRDTWSPAGGRRPRRHVVNCLALAGVALLAGPAAPSLPADESTPVSYEVMGAPSRPKVEARWNRYYDYREATELLQQLAAAHPDLVRLESLGKSYGGRDMWVVTITKSGLPDDRPAFWIDGGIHANEIQSVETVLYTAWYLAETANQNPEIAELLTERIFYLCPMLSPDSRDAHFHEPNSTHSPRTGQRPVDDDRDGLLDEDGPDDLDGDGHIVMMRVADPNGDFREDDKMPGRLVRVEPGEKGTHRLLGQEGIDDDGDGRVNEDGDGSYDPNRDWGWNWQPRYVQGGAYRYPFSLPENRLVADFIAAHPNIAGAQSYHNSGGMILRGPGAKSDRYDPRDIRVYDRLGKQGERMLPHYRYLNTAEDLYEVYGGEIDWLHQSQGIFAFTNELFTGWHLFRSDTKGEPSGYFGSSDDQHEFNRYLLLGQGRVAWHEVDHPQYGRVEVGGFKKNWVRQPPSFLLEEECHRNMAFTLYHAHEMPRVEVQSLTVAPAANGLFQVTAVVENTRTIPTHSAADVTRKITPPDVISIEGDHLQVVVGWQSNEPFFEEAEDQRRHPDRLRVRRIDGHSVVYARWWVSGEGKINVRIDSTKGGQDTATAELLVPAPHVDP